MKTEKTAHHWVNPKWVDCAPVRESINPTTREILGRYADADRRGHI